MSATPSRFYVELDEKSKKDVRFLLRQTTNLWNCMVTHIGESVLETIRSQDNVSSEAIMGSVDELVHIAYRILILGQDLGVDFRINDYWHQRVAYIRKIPRSVQENRIHDLIQSYRYAHFKYMMGSPYPYVPGIKIAGSTETARFNAGQWRLDGNMITITYGQQEVSFKVRNAALIPTSSCKMTLTKKRPGRIKPTHGEEDHKSTSFYVTFTTS